MNECLLVEKDEKGIVILTLNRPSSANALNTLLLQTLSETLDRLRHEPDVRAVILTSAGNRIFCAGADLKERKGMDQNTVSKTVALIGETVQRVEAIPFPVIAAMNGSAFGGGLELALACDMRIASEQGQYGLTETSLAIIPGAGGTQRLPRIIGTARAKELIFTARRLGALEGYSIGLFNKTVPVEAVFEEAYRLAEMIAANGPIAIQQAKKAIDTGLQADLQSGLKIENICYSATIPTSDRVEGLAAFAEKRKPNYKGE
ncbi:enoyl-CoA hydratase [Bacillus sp. 1P06AnD]|uniref:enoyl-CoA hydratase n=1 Tax=Bacillus sp. 1P06AnD TaxID=3132208 RepID=UPI00399F370E